MSKDIRKKLLTRAVASAECKSVDDPIYEIRGMKQVRMQR